VSLGAHLEDVDAARIGLSIRALRRRARLTQAELGVRAGMSASLVSRIERGHGRRVSFRLLERVTDALGARLVVAVQWQGEALDRLLDADHARLVEWAIGWLQRNGWETVPEVTFQVGADRGSIDILARHQAGAFLVVEVKTTIPDAQATLAPLDRKVRLAARIAAERGWRATTQVSRLLIVPSDSTTRRRIDALRSTFDAVLPDRVMRIRRYVAEPAGAVAGILFVSNVTQEQPRHRVSPHRPGA
jgi:transcriptional regulator with XRE-family HTH domain